jgi:hypothetical protein
MLSIIFWIAVGAFIGWNWPQPAFAKKLQEEYLQKWYVTVKGWIKRNPA